ncbi:MAG: ComF family protein [Candidatus Omnitrophica bacterium]|nr:ComF family protein [Candidatus Omnitrophota bacterium]
MLFLDLVYPTSCPLCGKRLVFEEAGGLCPSCLSHIPKNLPPFCPTCGRNFIGTEAAIQCGACEGRAFLFERLWFLYPYEGRVREVLHILKYRGRKPLANALANPLIAFAREHLKTFHFDWILPVPLFRRKKRERQFNQSELLAKALARSLTIPFSNENLIRNRATLPQAGLPKEERFENVQGAFHVRYSSLYAQKSLLLIDDIVTTGATLTACAEALRKAGAARISVLALARG